MKKCPYCSAEILDDADFCLYCMRQLTPKTEIVSKSVKSKIWLILLSIMVALVICGVIVFFALCGKYGFAKTQSALSTYNENSLFDTQEEQPQNKNDNFFDFLFKKHGKDDDETDKTQDDVKDDSDDHSNTTHTESGGDDEDDYHNKESTDKESQDSSPSSEESSSVNGSSGVSSKEESTPAPKPQQIWNFKEVSGGVEILGIAIYNDNGNYTIPNQIDGKSVVGIGYKAFYYEDSIKSIALPNTLQYIGEMAFAGCDSITEIYIPSSVRRIENNAFLPCDKLSNIYIASTNISIANYAFSSTYQRSVPLTIHAPSSVMDRMKAKVYWDAEYKEYNP